MSLKQFHSNSTSNIRQDAAGSDRRGARCQTQIINRRIFSHTGCILMSGLSVFQLKHLYMHSTSVKLKPKLMAAFLLSPPQQVVTSTPHPTRASTVRRCGLAWRAGPAPRLTPRWPSATASCSCVSTDTEPASWCPRCVTWPTSWRTTPRRRCCPWRSASETHTSTWRWEFQLPAPLIQSLKAYIYIFLPWGDCCRTAVYLQDICPSFSNLVSVIDSITHCHRVQQLPSPS